MRLLMMNEDSFSNSDEDNDGYDIIMMMKMIIGSLSIVSISLLFENPAAFIILESESNFTRRVSNLFKICFPRFLNFPFYQLKKDSTEFFEMRILLIMIIMLMYF